MTIPLAFLVLAHLSVGTGRVSESQDFRKTSLCVEAERFQELGGWTIDSQFRGIMGSTYLIAAGIGTPVEDACTRLALPGPGAYRLWVRCKDWHESSPGAFQVLVDDAASEVTFGTQKRGWAWIPGGDFDLQGPFVTLRLHDLSGYYGRCDAILLTRDTSFQPPEDRQGLDAVRQALLGESPKETRHFDFVVIGGGYGGVAAAIQAGRLGLKTALVQNRPCLGGNASKEIKVGPGGASPHTSAFRETGVPEEIAEGRFHPGSQNWSDAIDLLVRDVPNLSVFLETEGTRAIMGGKGHIEAVEAEHVVSGKITRFRAPLFADCTGDGGIAFSAGASFRVGEEGREEYGESIAPQSPSHHTMGTSIIHHSSRMDTPQPFTPPDFAVQFTPEHFTRREGSKLLQGTWWIEYGGMKDTIQDAEEIRDELIRVIFGAFDWAKNRDPNRPADAEFYRLTDVPIVGGKRESRRFMGDIVLAQNDVQNATLFPDRIAIGGWPIDIHPSPGIYGKDIPPAVFNPLHQVYSIPYRILYTRDVDNLFLAGRHVSVSHVALGSTRLMQTIGAMGQAVGVGAFLCKKYSTTPSSLYPGHIQELQQILLRYDALILQVKNEDPGDLCRTAMVTASSVAPEAVLEMEACDLPFNREAPCDTYRGQAIMTAQNNVQKISLFLSASGNTPVSARLDIGRGTKPEPEPEPENVENPIVSLTASVDPGGYRWVDFSLPSPIEPMQSYWVILHPARGLSWKIADTARSQRCYGKPGEWTWTNGVYAIRPCGFLRDLGNVGPEAAIDGVKWPWNGEAHQWRSDPEKGLPQWIELDFGKKVRINTVYLTFDTNIFGRFPSVDPAGTVTAEDYRLLCLKRGQWRTVFEEKGNWRRFRRHAFDTLSTSGIRLEILKSRNGEEARLYEIRACRE